MRWKNTDASLPELKEGESYFTVRYWVAPRVGYRTVVAAKDTKAARKWFENHFPAAGIHSVRKGTY